jgi:Ca2+-binding EF-hand superfamily protein
MSDDTVVEYVEIEIGGKMIKFAPLKPTLKTMRYMGLMIGQKRKNTDVLRIIDAIEESLSPNYDDDEISEILDNIDLTSDGGVELIQKISQAMFRNLLG